MNVFWATVWNMGRRGKLYTHLVAIHIRIMCPADLIQIAFITVEDFKHYTVGHFFETRCSICTTVIKCVGHILIKSDGAAHVQYQGEQLYVYNRWSVLLAILISVLRVQLESCRHCSSSSAAVILICSCHAAMTHRVVF